jgi:hypothetical protein
MLRAPEARHGDAVRRTNRVPPLRGSTSCRQPTQRFRVSYETRYPGVLIQRCRAHNLNSNEPLTYASASLAVRAAPPTTLVMRFKL